jgi:hypothetical protein
VRSALPLASMLVLQWSAHCRATEHRVECDKICYTLYAPRASHAAEDLAHCV